MMSSTSGILFRKNLWSKTDANFLNFTGKKCNKQYARKYIAQRAFNWTMKTNCNQSAGLFRGNFSLILPQKLQFSSSFSTVLWDRSHCPLSTTVLRENYSSYSKKKKEKEYYATSKGHSSRTQLYYTLKQYIRSPENAETFVSHLKKEERRLLLHALNSSVGSEISNAQGEESGDITRRQLYLVFLHNCIPFIGFGFLDNAIMIVAGEYIDHTIGLTLGITTMAAAALGNTISDLAGIGLAGYVEMMFLRLGLPVPALTPEQAELKSTIFSSNMGKAFGILIGCIIGMCPLLFIGDDKEEDDELDLD